jgi:hypothetical protein
VVFRFDTFTHLEGWLIRVVAEKGQVVTVDMAPVIQARNRFARQFAEKA